MGAFLRRRRFIYILFLSHSFYFYFVMLATSRGQEDLGNVMHSGMVTLLTLGKQSWDVCYEQRGL